MIDDVQALLKRWGRWVREEQDQPRGIGYPSQAIGAEAMMPPPSRTQAEQSEADRLANIAKTSGTYRTSPEGKREKVRPMIEQTQPKDSRSRKPRSPEYEPAPLEMRLCDNAVNSLPEQCHQLIMARYVVKISIREIAKEQGVTYAQAREHLAFCEGRVLDRIEQAA